MSFNANYAFLFNLYLPRKSPEIHFLFNMPKCLSCLSPLCVTFNVGISSHTWFMFSTIIQIELPVFICMCVSCVCVHSLVRRRGIAEAEESPVVLKGTAGRGDWASCSSCPGDVSDDNHPHSYCWLRLSGLGRWCVQPQACSESEQRPVKHITSHERTCRMSLCELWEKVTLIKWNEKSKRHHECKWNDGTFTRYEWKF